MKVSCQRQCLTQCVCEQPVCSLCVSEPLYRQPLVDLSPFLDRNIYIYRRKPNFIHYKPSPRLGLYFSPLIFCVFLFFFLNLSVYPSDVYVGYRAARSQSPGATDAGGSLLIEASLWLLRCPVLKRTALATADFTSGARRRREDAQDKGERLRRMHFPWPPRCVNF